MDYYYHPLSSNCRKTTALLDHTGIEAARHVVKLADGEQLGDAYRAINPNQKVPALVDGDRKIWESNAIAIYLARSVGSDLWPEDADLRLEILRWMFWEQGQLMREAGALFFERIIKPLIGQGEPSQTAIDAATERFRRLATVLDAHLADTGYLAGGRLTLADWAVACHLGLAEQTGLPIGDYPRIGQWLARLDETPAWKGTAPQLPG
jgi:glutathione S-transferase